MYQTLRSVSDHHVFVVYRDGSFYELVPEEVRKQGPWQGMRRGEIELLKAEYRLALARDGYALVKCELAVFKPETRSAVTCSKARGRPFLFRPSPRHRRDRNPTIWHCHVKRKFAGQMSMAATVHAATVAWRHVSIS